MENSLRNYIASFTELEDLDKRVEIIRHMKELYNYLIKVNGGEDYPILEEFDSDEQFLDYVFQYLIAIKELTAISLNN